MSQKLNCVFRGLVEITAFPQEVSPWWGWGFLWNLLLRALAKALLCSLRPGKLVDTACWVSSAGGPSFLFVQRTLEIHRGMHHALSLLKTFWPHNTFCSSPVPCREVAIPPFLGKRMKSQRYAPFLKCVQSVSGRGWTWTQSSWFPAYWVWALKNLITLSYIKEGL